MWLHVCLLFFIMILGILLETGEQTKQKKIIVIVYSFGLFLILSAFRAENVGNDTRDYLMLFSSISQLNDISYFSGRYEIGFLQLNKLLSLITSHPQIIIIVTSLITVLGYARFIYKYSKITWLSAFLFVTLGYYGMTMNTIRLNLAIVIILFAYDYLRERKLLKFIAVVIFASLFHRTALVFLLAWPITKLKFNKKTVFLMVLFSIVIYFMFPAILNLTISLFPVYQYYLGSQYFSGDIRLASVLNLLVGIMIILFGVITNNNYRANELIDRDINNSVSTQNNANDAHNMLLLLAIGVCITFISFNFNLLDRVSDYFLVFSCVYLPNAIKEIKDKMLIVNIIFIVVILFFTYDSTIQILRPEWNRIYPYDFFWRF